MIVLSYSPQGGGFPGSPADGWPVSPLRLRQLGLRVDSAFDSPLGPAVRWAWEGVDRGKCPRGRPGLKMHSGMETKYSKLASYFPPRANAQVGAPRAALLLRVER